MSHTKYTFAIIPFRFEREFAHFNEEVAGADFWEKSTLSYGRLYRHATACFDTQSEMWGASEYLYDFTKGMRSGIGLNSNKKYEMSFAVENKTYSMQISFPLVKLFLFETRIGFLAVNVSFGRDAEFDDVCAACNALKMLRAPNTAPRDNYLIISDQGDDTQQVNLLEFARTVLPQDCRIAFEQRSSNNHTAVMLSSFLFERDIDEQEAADCLQMLKRAQGRGHNSTASDYGRMMRPFRNMYWDFSSQGVANINYISDTTDNNYFFREAFHRNVSTGYLLMTVLLLHQEYTLLDYCQCLSTVRSDNQLENRLEQMYEFKMKYIGSTVSHLEHYREFYHRLRDALDIDELLEEVEMKLQSMYAHISKQQAAEQLEIEKENARRQKEMDELRMAYMEEENEQKERLSAVISIASGLIALLSFASIISDSVQSINLIGARNFLLFMLGAAVVTVLIMIIAYFALPGIKRRFRKPPADGSGKK